MGGLVDLGDVHGLSDLDAAAVQQNDGGFLVGRRRVLGEEIGDRLKIGEVARVVHGGGGDRLPPVDPVLIAKRPDLGALRCVGGAGRVSQGNVKVAGQRPYCSSNGAATA